MMVPRSYRYTSPTPTKSTKRNEKDAVAASVAERKSSKTTEKKEKEEVKPFGMPPKMFSPPPATPSKPVIIPTRARNGGLKKGRESVPKDKGENVGVPHDSSSTPSSVAALLAMTTLSESQYNSKIDTRRRLSYASHRMQEATSREIPRRAISSSSPQSWGMLLSPPEESVMESGSFESDTTLGPLSSVRSLSTESMPSLETDNESLGSSSNPATPGLLHSSRDRRQKSLSASKGEDCVFDHPLLPQIPKQVLEDGCLDGAPSFLSPTPSPLARSRSFFQSNLTASFRKICSAAQSFSALTAPPSQREDYLARTLLSMDSHFTDERRPLPSIEPPDPALRRYLNPTTFSPAEFHFHSDQESSQAMRPSCTASIQLQIYQRPHRESDKASSPPVFSSSQQKALDAVDGLPQTSSPRQREPRENSDFLRVIVLEMNMRKMGKLSDASPGRARLWLPARQVGKIAESGGEQEGVPSRWTGIRA